MKISADTFGLVIAFLLPGFIVLVGLSIALPDVAVWMVQSTDSSGPTVGGFLYSTLASLALGLLISAIRWAIIDKTHELTGVQDTELDFSKLTSESTLKAFQAAVEAHYRFYQYYANTFVGVVISFSFIKFFSSYELSYVHYSFVVIISLFLFCGSRDALKKYNQRAAKILNNG